MNDLTSDTVDVEVYADRFYTLKIRNPKIGKVKIVRNTSTNVIKVYGQIPDGQSFAQYSTALIGNAKQVAFDIGRLKSIKATYE